MFTEKPPRDVSRAETKSHYYWFRSTISRRIQLSVEPAAQHSFAACVRGVAVCAVCAVCTGVCYEASQSGLTIYEVFLVISL
jgi:hypothetical protein